MQRDDILYQSYLEILNEELMPAMGCTEPISIAYCASKLRECLGRLPQKIDVFVSGNILKNVKSVIVPHTNGLHGIEAAVGVGVVAGNPDKELEVISDVTNEDITKLNEYLKETPIKVRASNNKHTLYIELIGYAEKDVARIIIRDSHTHIYLIEKNGVVLHQKEVENKRNAKNTDKTILSVEKILDFANTCHIEDVKPVLDRQIKCNMKIANEGINNNYGANIGRTILKYSPDDIISYCKALAAAGSDARMNGCSMPVVINSGSGNQGLTASVPVIAYAEKTNKSKELLYRSLVLSNLCTTHIKNNIGKLSAYCGVVIAGSCSGAAIAYLEGATLEQISNTIVNSLAIISGVVCDGAKSSCAAKIASSVEAGFLGYYMSKEGNNFFSGDGIVKRGVEKTIEAVGKLARVGMCETDKEIIHIMLD